MHRPSFLISAVTFPCLGLSLLFCFSARPPLKPFTDTGDERQPRPAADNKTWLILLHSQYGYCERCRRSLRLARTAHEEARWRGNTREAVRLYNQAANDADPSAFALTALPRHLGQEAVD